MPSAEYEKYKSVFGVLLQVLAEEFRVSIMNFGSTTFKKDYLERGLEPDQCYYLQNLAAIRGKRRIDLSIDSGDQFLGNRCSRQQFRMSRKIRQDNCGRDDCNSVANQACQTSIGFHRVSPE